VEKSKFQISNAKGMSNYRLRSRKSQVKVKAKVEKKLDLSLNLYFKI